MASLPPTTHRPTDPMWRVFARCRQVSATHFFTPGRLERKAEREAREAQARALCRECPVRVDCLEYALAVREPHGIWGGLNELERRRLLRSRDAQGQPQSA